MIITTVNKRYGIVNYTSAQVNVSSRRRPREIIQGARAHESSGNIKLVYTMTLTRIENNQIAIPFFRMTDEANKKNGHQHPSGK